MDSPTQTMQSPHTILQSAHSQKLSGKLTIHAQGKRLVQWDFFFYAGMLVWLNKETHRSRRWLRTYKSKASECYQTQWSKIIAESQPSFFNGPYWELETIEKLRRVGCISLDEIKAILESYLHEAFLDLCTGDTLQSQFEAASDPEKVPRSLVFIDLKTIRDTSVIWQKQKQQLAKVHSQNLMDHLSFDLGLKIEDPDHLREQVNPLIFDTLVKVVNGKNTFWDIATLIRQDIVAVAVVLTPLIEGGSISLQEVADINFKLNSSTSVSIKRTDKNATSKGIIACIDDSPVIGAELEKLIAPLGYSTLSITDPLKELSQLVKTNPCLIFLDLVMPNTNGYEICSLLRKMSQFKETPIVMLTGHDGIVDRLRAKMAGSTDFISKPPEPIKVQGVINKYLMLAAHETEMSPTGG